MRSAMQPPQWRVACQEDTSGGHSAVVQEDSIKPLALPQHSHTYDQPSGQGSDLSSTRSPWSRENNNNNGIHENYKFQGNKYANANNGNNPAAQQVAAQRAAAVKDAFQTAWTGYYQYAFPNDELLPVNNSFSNSR
ncbi:hypothetical protein LTR04_003504 [Oleoguttula sp. CCFEE 6159]|nr:hypothetical protein LTR04_003504 [Oleoguttula sp. CCFEE 6159]